MDQEVSQAVPPGLPEWLDRALSREEIDRIEIAVKSAEKKTSAEIVPMIVHRSTLKATGDRILFWISFGVLGIGGAVGLSLSGGLDEALLDRVLEAFGIWPSEAAFLWLALLAEAFVALVAFGISWVFAKWVSQFDRAHRFVFPTGDLTLEAEHRAQSEFYSSDLRSTSGRNGILLFVSMLERRAVILADKAIIEKIDPSTWTETLSRLLSDLGNGEMGRGYVDAIDSIAKRLEGQFPAQPNDRDELSNRLRIEE